MIFAISHRRGNSFSRGRGDSTLAELSSPSALHEGVSFADLSAILPPDSQHPLMKDGSRDNSPLSARNHTKSTPHEPAFTPWTRTCLRDVLSPAVIEMDQRTLSRMDDAPDRSRGGASHPPTARSIICPRLARTLSVTPAVSRQDTRLASTRDRPVVGHASRLCCRPAPEDEVLGARASKENILSCTIDCTAGAARSLTGDSRQRSGRHFHERPWSGLPRRRAPTMSTIEWCYRSLAVRSLCVVPLLDPISPPCDEYAITCIWPSGLLDASMSIMPHEADAFDVSSNPRHMKA